VTPTNYVNLPDLLTVYRGHASRVTCVKIVRVGTHMRIFSGSMDGRVIVWDLRTGAPLSIISAHDQGVSSIDVLSVEAVGARRPQFMSTHMVRRTTTPNWHAPHVTADIESAEPTQLNARGSGFIFELENMQQAVTLRVYAVVKNRGDVVVGCASITLQDVLKKAYETECAERVTLHVPLLLLLPKASQAQKFDSDAEEQGITELNSPDAGAGALLNMLAAATIHSAGATGEACDLDFQVTGELDVTLAYRRASGGQKELVVQPMRASIKSSRLRKSQLNTYCNVEVKAAPRQRVFVAGGASVRSYDLEYEAMVQEFVGHTGAVTSVVASRLVKTDYLFTGSLDRTARMWNVATGTALRVFDAHTDAVTCIHLLEWGAAPRMKAIAVDKRLHGLSTLELKLTYSDIDPDVVCFDEKHVEVAILSLNNLHFPKDTGVTKVSITVTALDIAECSTTYKSVHTLSAFDDSICHRFEHIPAGTELEIILYVGGVVDSVEMEKKTLAKKMIDKLEDITGDIASQSITLAASSSSQCDVPIFLRAGYRWRRSGGRFCVSRACSPPDGRQRHHGFRRPVKEICHLIRPAHVGAQQRHAIHWRRTR
jgi:WD40 repeat protein